MKGDSGGPPSTDRPKISEDKQSGKTRPIPGRVQKPQVPGIFPKIDGNIYSYKLTFVNHDAVFFSFAERKLSPYFVFGNDLGCSLSVSLHGVFHRILIKVTGGS